MQSMTESIRPSADLRSRYSEISRLCREEREAVIITVNGRGDTVSLGYEQYQQLKAKIELLESTDPEGTIAKFIEKRGEGIHHMAFSTPSVQTRLDELEAKGVRLIDKAPRKGAEGLNIAFLHPKSTHGVLTEI